MFGSITDPLALTDLEESPILSPNLDFVSPKGRGTLEIPQDYTMDKTQIAPQSAHLANITPDSEFVLEKKGVASRVLRGKSEVPGHIQK